jgi:peroxiredoxin
MIYSQRQSTKTIPIPSSVMNHKIIAALAIALLLLSGLPGSAAEQSAAAELKALITKVQLKLKEGKKTEKEFADEVKAFDDLLANHKAEKTDDVANILYMKAMLYLQVFNDSEKSKELLSQLKRDFPESGQVAALKKQEEAEKMRASLVEGGKFPDFDEKDLKGQPLSIAKYKGKVVLIDFWATWCGPCVRELPNVLSTYEKHHKDGFEIIGISLDREEARLTSFMKEKNMPWQQFFDGGYWNNKLAVRYGVNSIPATYLLDGEGKIIAKDLRGGDLDAAVAKALAKK